MLLGGFDQLNPRLDGVVFDCGLVHVSAPLQSEFCPNNSEAIGCPLPSTVGRLTSDIPYQQVSRSTGSVHLFPVFMDAENLSLLGRILRAAGPAENDRIPRSDIILFLEP